MKTITMMMNKKILTLFLLLCALGACSSPNKDMTAPEILPIGNVACPLNCQEFSRGGVIPFAYAFSDDVELGSFNLEIHNNFDHHTHSTEAGDCIQDPDKDPVNPWILNKDYKIPSGKTYYEAEMNISIPEDADLGEYHFMIRVTDASGWQQLRSVSIRIVDNED